MVNLFSIRLLLLFEFIVSTGGNSVVLLVVGGLRGLVLAE